MILKTHIHIDSFTHLLQNELAIIMFSGLKTQYVKYYQMKYKKRPLLRCAQCFQLDLINNMYHMRISGTEPPSVIPSETK